VGTEEEVRMDSKLIHEEGGEKTFVLVFDTGDEVVSQITTFARENDLDAASITAIGAFSGATLGYFDIEKIEYEKIPLEEQVEVLSLIGDIALNEGEPELHAHVVLGRRDGTTRGGHLLEAHVRPTLEAVLIELPDHLKKTTDEETGLALIDIRDG
jgi:predicted DNA-binding protein with PD1-like motif